MNENYMVAPDITLYSGTVPVAVQRSVPMYILQMKAGTYCQKSKIFGVKWLTCMLRHIFLNMLKEGIIE